MVVLALTLSLVVPVATSSPVGAAARADDPPVRVELSDDVFARGERARVRVTAARDGYLVVLRADAEGRIRVLFPLAPGDAAAVRGGREIEVRGRGNREAFTIDEGEGSGKVLAAWSAAPFRFDAFARGGHWDYGALAAEAGEGARPDPEARLLGLVDRMAEGEYEYDLVTYTVTARAAGRRSWGWCDPWLYPRWGCWPGFYGPRFGTTIVIRGSSRRGRRH
jgi:hypothetical protein